KLMKKLSDSYIALKSYDVYTSSENYLLAQKDRRGRESDVDLSSKASFDTNRDRQLILIMRSNSRICPFITISQPRYTGIYAEYSTRPQVAYRISILTKLLQILSGPNTAAS